MAGKSWKSYVTIVRETIPRIKDGEPELEHRARLLWARDWASSKRECVGWHADHALHTIIALSTAYALSIRARPEQIATLWDAVAGLMTIAGQLQASELV